MADNYNLDPEIVKQFADALVNATREMDPIVQAEKQAAIQAKALADEMGKLKKQLGESTASLFKMTASSTKGSAKYGQAIEGATGALGKMVALSGPLGMLSKAVGGIINIFGQLANASLKQNDALMKSYQDLSKFGANSSSQLNELLENLHRAGFNVENAEQFVTSLRKVSPELSMFGAATGAGAKKLTDVFTRSLGNTEKQLARFGYTTEEMFDFTASYIAQQTMTGGVRLKTEKQLNQESTEYMKTLAELSMLTGAQRDELDKNRRAQENDLRYQFALRKLETSDRQEDREQAKRIRLQVDSYNAIGAKSVAEGFKSIIANQGKVTDDIAADLQFMVGNEGIGMMVDATKKGGDAVLNMADLFRQLGPLAGRSLTNMEKNFSASNDNLKGIFDGIAAYNLMLRGESVNRENLEKEIRKIEQQGKDDRIDANKRREINERTLNFSIENMTYSVGNMVVPAMTKLTDITNIVAQTFAKLVKGLTFGLVDYTKQFQTAADITENAKEDWKKFQETGKKLADLEERKKKEVEGSAEFKKLTEEIAQTKQGRKTLAESLAKQSERRQQLGGSAMFSGTAMKQLGEAMAYGTAKSSTNNAGSQTPIKELDELFDFSDPFAKDRFHALDQNLAQKLVAAAKDYKDATNGKKLQINSTLRTEQEQAELYAKYLKGGTIAAPPGHSKHENGMAVDIQQGKGDSEAIRILNSHGLVQKVKGDEVHFEGAYNGGIFKGPKSGYWTKLHGTEAVLNEKQMAAMSNNITKNAIPGGGGFNSASSNIKDFVMAVLDKLDELVDLQNRNVRTNEEHLQYAKSN